MTPQRLAVLDEDAVWRTIDTERLGLADLLADLTPGAVGDPVDLLRLAGP